MSTSFSGDIGDPGGEVAARAARAIRSTESVVFVDVGTRRIDPSVVRNGLPVVAHRVNTDVLDGVIVQRPILRVRVVGQSVPAGTPVPLGTAVNLVMAPPAQLPVGVIEGTHLALRDIEMAEAYRRFVAGRPQVNRIVARAAAGALPPEDEAAVREIFTQEGVDLADTPGRDVGAAIETLSVLTTFGG